MARVEAGERETKGVKMAARESGKSAEYRKGNPEKVKKLKRKGDVANPAKVRGYSLDQSTKGGKGYLKMRAYSQQPVPNARHRVRARHETKYRGIKLLLESFFEGLKLQLRHQWLSGTAEYTGLALVDTERHQRGIISVVYPLEGVITWS